jgi:hypothetical protein
MKYQTARNGEITGAFSLEDLRHAIRAGTVAPDDFVRSEGWTEWKTVNVVPELAQAKASKDPNADFFGCRGPLIS